MEQEKISVICTVNHRVSVFVRAMAFSREWVGKGAVQKIDKETLEQLMYDPGTRYMFDKGILYIEDMEPKKELGLEPETATEPVNIIVLNDKQKRDCLIKLSYKQFCETVDKLSHDQQIELARYAIANKLIDFDRDEYIKSKCGIDIITAIRLESQSKEV